jgi:MarR family transcriptional regulator, 2-MHQ and catechol-resistance regulon repressor
VLEALWHIGPMRQCDLAEKVLVSASNLTTVIDNLERDGFVQRQRDPADRRVSITALTPEGEARVTAFFPTHVARLAEAMSALDTNELTQLAQLCRKLGLAARATKRTPA